MKAVEMMSSVGRLTDEPLCKLGGGGRLGYRLSGQQAHTPYRRALGPV